MSGERVQSVPKTVEENEMLLKTRLDELLRSFPLEPLADVFGYLERVAVSIAFMAGAIAIMKFPGIALPAAPLVAVLLGFGLLIGSFALLVFVGLSGWHMVLKKRGYTWLNHGLGLVIFLATVPFVVASAVSVFLS